MKVRILVTSPGDASPGVSGEVVDVPDDQGQALVDAGRAERAEPRPKTRKPKGEQAVAPPSGEKRG